MIEVVIADVQITDDTEIGVNWDNIFDTEWDGTYTQSLVTTLATAGTIGADLSIIRSNISGTLHALQQVRNVEILASPRVLVLSGQEAEIKTVEEIPYEEASDTSEGGAGAITSIEFKNVGITLKVKATVTQNGQILMEVEPEQSVATGEVGVQDVPIVDSRSAKTTLLVQDGHVVVLGGLRRRETRLSTDRVPGLGKIPVIGLLFSRNQEVVENSELLVMISPHIYRDGEITSEQLERFNDLRDRPLLRIPIEPLEPEIIFRDSEAPWSNDAP
jgi:general secretion pathway protein D